MEHCEDELVCDLAEVYHVFDYKSLPVIFVATLTAGLREDARIWHRLNDDNPFFTDQRRLLVSIYDILQIIKWLQTTDGAEGVNFPESLYKKIYNIESPEEVRKFRSGDEFKREWEATVRKKNGNIR